MQQATQSVDPSDFTKFDPVPPEGIERAVQMMQTGQLFRYAAPTAAASEAALLERDVAAMLGVGGALAVSSCSQGLVVALIASGIGPGSRVLCPGFTFTAVPSAVRIGGATPVFVECNKDFVVDLDDLARRLREGADAVLLSHMRGWIADMDAVAGLCAQHGADLIEDAAHAFGARWRGKPVGTFGRVACLSFQSNKIVNAGEGGMIVTDDKPLLGRSLVLSGAYESSARKHFGPSELALGLSGELPAHNTRMSELTAAVARPQLRQIEDKARRYRAMNARLQSELSANGRIAFPRTPPEATRVPDSLQFRVADMDAAEVDRFVHRVRARGLPLKRFGADGNARAYWNWRYLGADAPSLPQTRQAIETACDLRLPSTLGAAHLDFIVETIGEALDERAAAVA